MRFEDDTVKNTTVQDIAAPPKNSLVFGRVCFAVIPLSPPNTTSHEQHSLHPQSSLSSSSPSQLPTPMDTSPETAGIEPLNCLPAAALQQPAAACLAPERATPPPAAQIATHKPERQACYLCMDRRADTVLVECGHGGLCGVCAAALWRSAAAAPGAERRCPLCRLPFVGVMLIVGEAAGTVRA